MHGWTHLHSKVHTPQNWVQLFLPNLQQINLQGYGILPPRCTDLGPRKLLLFLSIPGRLLFLCPSGLTWICTQTIKMNIRRSQTFIVEDAMYATIWVWGLVIYLSTARFKSKWSTYMFRVDPDNTCMPHSFTKVYKSSKIQHRWVNTFQIRGCVSCYFVCHWICHIPFSLIYPRYECPTQTM